ncbi:hypothetical protein NOR51B_139 [Luminiphilus syltensis NOR5-1B]|uniref:Uncharacterized protein n=1 Tax=Luminiphilus syltensis NOR5-1B TaxID=565045 RepID=B8KSG7_9GAMM|nr:hypothetical protein NOR51B_139 [Luminiphilus syltensis NOR5-1B]
MNRRGARADIGKTREIVPVYIATAVPKPKLMFFKEELQ